MNKKSVMKTLLSFLFSLVLSLQIFAQVSSVVSVDIRYRIDPEDSTNSKIFLSRVLGQLTVADKKKMLEFTASRILMKTKLGDSVAIYNPTLELNCGFSPWTSIVDFQKVKPADLAKPAAQIGDQSWLTAGTHYHFKFQKGNAVAEHDITVFSDKRIAYAANETMTSDAKGNVHEVMEYRYIDAEKTSVFFNENWSFDSESGSLIKKVNHYGYYVPNFADGRGFVGYSSALCIENPYFLPLPTKDILLRKNVVCDVTPNWPKQMLENDVNIMRMQGPDAVNFLSIPEGNIPENDRAKFIAAIFSYAYNHTGNIFPVQNNTIDYNHPFQTKKQLDDVFTKQDIVMMEDPNFPGTFLEVVVSNVQKMDAIYAIRFYEDWYYDSTELTMKKVVRGVGFIMKSATNMGDLLLEDAGVYIKMN